ncbi:hypothetical protein FHX06_006539 [Rhizobium sp. BK512]|nr:hypothetical protein [Rhizobium sp. BK512]
MALDVLTDPGFACPPRCSFRFGRLRDGWPSQQAAARIPALRPRLLAPCRAAVASPDRCSKRLPQSGHPKPQHERDIWRMKSTGGRQPRQCWENFDEHSAFLAFEAGHPSKHKVPVACVSVVADFVVVLCSRRRERFSAPAIPRGLQGVAEQPIFCRDADVFGGVRHHWEKQYASGQGRSRR